jgi:hypothetical protein
MIFLLITIRYRSLKFKFILNLNTDKQSRTWSPRLVLKFMLTRRPRWFPNHGCRLVMCRATPISCSSSLTHSFSFSVSHYHLFFMNLTSCTMNESPLSKHYYNTLTVKFSKIVTQAYSLFDKCKWSCLQSNFDCSPTENNN